MTVGEMEEELWDHEIHHTPPQIVLNGDIRLFPSADPEGNGTGWFVGLDEDELIGTTFQFGRELSEEEFDRFGWSETIHRPPTVLTFEDDSGRKHEVLPACDPELNGPGAVFGRDGDAAFGFKPDDSNTESDGPEPDDSHDDLTDEKIE